MQIGEFGAGGEVREERGGAGAGEEARLGADRAGGVGGKPVLGGAAGEGGDAGIVEAREVERGGVIGDR